jgi:outer membrane biosynthesis protein TonB
MAALDSYYRVYELPWALSSEQEQQFKKLLLRCLGALLILTILFSILPVPEPDPSEIQEIPKRFAKLMLERKAPPPPPPPQVKEEPKPEPEPEKVVQEKPVEPEPVVKPEPQPEPEPAPQPDRTELAREKAKVAGLLPFANQLADLRDNSALNKLEQAEKLGAPKGDTPRAERSLITSKVGSGSGGINTARLSRNTGGAGLAGRQTTQVAAPVAEFGTGGGAARRTGESNKGSRSREEIEMVFDRNKGAIYALYNRALRRDPSLEGKLVLRLTIAPDGAVTFCEVVSSELENADLERKLVQRILLFRFEAKDVEAVTTTKPIDFFPA